MGRATLDAAGRRNVVGTVHVWTDDRADKPTAIAQGTYVLPRSLSLRTCNTRVEERS